VPYSITGTIVALRFGTKENPTPAPSRHVAGYLVQLGLSRPARLEQPEEDYVGAYGDPRADQGLTVRRQAVDGPVVAMVEVHQDGASLWPGDLSGVLRLGGVHAGHNRVIDRQEFRDPGHRNVHQLSHGLGVVFRHHLLSCDFHVVHSRDFTGSPISWPYMTSDWDHLDGGDDEASIR
jgi:hypothetical protein